MASFVFTVPVGVDLENLDPGSYAAWELYRENTSEPCLSLWDWIEQNPHYAEYYAEPAESLPAPTVPPDSVHPLPDYLVRELPRMLSGMPAENGGTD